MTTFYTKPLTRVNDKLYLKNADTHAVHEDYVSDVIPGRRADPTTKYQAKFYKNFGIDIVTETVFNYPYPYISEKTLRPITSKRPFIVLGAHGILQLLKDKGFLTFDSIIDESYDSIEDYSDRFDSVCASIKQFVIQPIEKIKQDVLSISDVLEHNFQHYKELEDIEISQLTMYNV